MASTNRSLVFSDQFAISCGTVTIDRKLSRILLIRWRKTGEVMLPKGRKEVGENLENTALRETFEETGVTPHLLPVDIVSLATTNPGFPRPQEVVEPFAVSQRTTNGILKIIFWYMAIADSTAAPEEGTQQEDEDFETVWISFEDAGSILSHEDDRRIAQRAIDMVSNHGR
ncbi:nudix domain-containing protein [Fusarium heterosporum]|uniref:Nudix domain-containing protein n=1 Tax=Fusarium heterosporum TaxID=42747 RepID=A0A8H5SXQ4_FUSHE|nr:nudix domain-containing protein [Fusarium heterosporum]